MLDKKIMVAQTLMNPMGSMKPYGSTHKDHSPQCRLESRTRQCRQGSSPQPLDRSLPG